MKWAAIAVVSLIGFQSSAAEREFVQADRTKEINQAVLDAVAKIQATAPDGGGYFTGLKASPPESPIGFPLCLFGSKLIDPPRATSYCSGASYAALVGALDSLLASRASDLTAERLEATRMQEPGGGRRDDMVKLWGWWNADGPGCLYALAMYSHLGSRIGAMDAQPGDFCNIQWQHGNGHSVVFLGWDTLANGEPAMRYWSSQKGTNGLGQQTSALSTMFGVVFVRLTNPEALFELDPAKRMEKAKIDFDSTSIVAERLKQRAGPSSKTGGR